MNGIEIIDEAVRLHGIKEVFALFSGGHDSLISTAIASDHPLFKGVLHINTGIGIPETRKFVVNTCRQQGWKLYIYSAKHNTREDGTPDPMIYRELVLRWGFPGAALHQFMYERLKGRQLARFLRDQKAGRQRRIGLVSGARILESDRRSRKFSGGLEIHKREGSKVWISPTLLWNDEDCSHFMKSNSLPRNPVKDALCMSGECLCGAFAQANELLQLEIFYPEIAAWIKALEKEVRAAGFPWGWEDSPPTWWKEKQRYESREASGQLSLLPLCSSCQMNSKIIDR